MPMRGMLQASAVLCVLGNEQSAAAMHARSGQARMHRSPCMGGCGATVCACLVSMHACAGKRARRPLLLFQQWLEGHIAALTCTVSSASQVQSSAMTPRGMRWRHACHGMRTRPGVEVSHLPSACACGQQSPQWPEAPLDWTRGLGRRCGCDAVVAAGQVLLCAPAAAGGTVAATMNQ